MNNFKRLCEKAFKEEIMDFDELSGNEQAGICQAFFEGKEGKGKATEIVSNLFSAGGYLSDKYSDFELGQKANMVISAFDLEIAVLDQVGPGPDMSCEFNPDGSRSGPS